MTDNKILFQGELQLVRWADSSNAGATVTFWVHPDDLEHFKLLRVRKGNKEAGTRIAAVMVEIGPDEAVVPQGPAEKPAPGAVYRPPVLGALAKVAVQWCRDPNFWKWATTAYASRMSYKGGGFYGPVEGEGAAKAFILEVCGLIDKHGQAASRKHLDTDPEAAAIFHERIRIPYRDWLQNHAQQK